MHIRPEAPADFAAIHKVTSAAFEKATEADLVDTLRADGDVVHSLVAEAADGDIAGHVLLSRLKRPENCLALGPVSVLPERQRTGIGSALIREALSRAGKAGFAAVFVLGEPHYYTRFGFSVTAAEPFEVPWPKEYFMALALQPDGLKGLAGPVIYPAAFTAADPA